MITPASTRNNPEKDIPVHSFYPDGSIAYIDKINIHFIWDVDSSICDPGCDCDLDNDDDDYCHHWSRRSRKNKKKAPLPIYKKALEIIHQEEKATQPCMMFSAASTSYDEDFPTLEKKSHQETKIQ